MKFEYVTFKMNNGLNNENIENYNFSTIKYDTFNINSFIPFCLCKQNFEDMIKELTNNKVSFNIPEIIKNVNNIIEYIDFNNSYKFIKNSKRNNFSEIFFSLSYFYHLLNKDNKNKYNNVIFNILIDCLSSDEKLLKNFLQIKTNSNHEKYLNISTNIKNTFHYDFLHIILKRFLNENKEKESLLRIIKSTFRNKNSFNHFENYIVNHQIDIIKYYNDFLHKEYKNKNTSSEDKYQNFNCQNSEESFAKILFINLNSTIMSLSTHLKDIEIINFNLILKHLFKKKFNKTFEIKIKYKNSIRCINSIADINKPLIEAIKYDNALYCFVLPYNNINYEDFLKEKIIDCALLQDALEYFKKYIHHYIAFINNNIDKKDFKEYLAKIDEKINLLENNTGTDSGKSRKKL